MNDLIFIFFLLSGVVFWGFILLVIVKIWMEK